ncbi:4Fe-4S dicluster domain-containing protein [uncultured Dysosmobacter sp.]|uniref:4Fe-4S dicluster domain-containing protein n=1 Tax=uncultured Dysosmobacter sp. TaxID=2591384 RepID=UPI002628E58B|nr:4Fe-4S dicluster domain-containing protein [uncultured Dysosmobacter sp.]
MATYSIVFSPTGGTRKVADIFCTALDKNVTTIDILHKAEYSFTTEDFCVISMPSFGGRIPTVCTNRMMDLHGNGARAVLVAVFGNRAIDDTLMEMKDLAVANGFVPVAAIEAVAEHSIMRQFATGRPDNQDRAELEAFAKRVKKLPGNPALVVPGNHPYKEYSGIPLKPFADIGCNACGECVNSCPVGAIPTDDPKSTNKDVCISCMRCIAICPKNVRKINSEILLAVGQGMAKLLSDRKENRLYF